MDIQQIKQRFDIIGNNPVFNRAIEIAMQVAPTDLSVLITGESGVGKERFPQIIHSYSSRKHASYVAVNCGAIPEGTIDSELFGHEKGAFTGAIDKRKGYFEVADGGTIFLDEVGELPLSTQVRLLRVLETGDFIKVGSSKVEKTNVRVVAATNRNITDLVKKGKFREDLYYRLNTVPIILPSLRERKEDIPVLFRKFSADFAEKYSMPPLHLDNLAREKLVNYPWPGNIRQLKNITEHISIIEKDREISDITLKKYLPKTENNSLPTLYKGDIVDEKTFHTEREILYQILFDMKQDMSDMKKIVADLMSERMGGNSSTTNHFVNTPNTVNDFTVINTEKNTEDKEINKTFITNVEDTEEFVEESLSIEEKEKELIQKALNKHHGKRKLAADDLGISEGSNFYLYREDQ